MTIIRDLDATDNDLPELLKKLKNACGAGGTIADGNVEVQGNQLDRVRAELQKIGYKVKG